MASSCQKFVDHKSNK